MKRQASTQKYGTAKKRKTTVASRSRADPQSFKTTNSLSPELKSLDNVLSTVIASGFGAANHNILLNCPIPGPDRQNRIGRRIHMKSAHVHVTLFPSNAAGPLVEDLVFLLVWDLEAGALPAMSSLLTDVDLAGTATTNVTSHINLDNSKRYTILKRKNVPYRPSLASPPVGMEQSSADNLDWTWNVKLNHITQFNSGNTGVIGDITNGALLFCYWSTTAVALGQTGMVATCRVRYYD